MFGLIPCGLPRRSAFVSALTTLFLLVGPASARAAAPGFGDLAYLAEEYPPLVYEEEGEIRGVYPEVLRMVWAYLGEPEHPIRLVPWARGMHFLDTDDNIVLFGASCTPERRAKYQCVYPVTETDYIVLARRSDDIEPGSCGDLGAFSVGAVRGCITEELARANGVSGQSLEVASSQIDLMTMFVRGRFDLIVIDEKAYRALLRLQHVPRDAVVKVRTLVSLPAGFLVSAGAPRDLVSRFQQALDAVKQTSEYDELLRRYWP